MMNRSVYLNRSHIPRTTPNLRATPNHGINGTTSKQVRSIPPHHVELAEAISSAFVNIRVTPEQLARQLKPADLCSILADMLRDIEELPADYDTERDEFNKRRLIFQSLKVVIKKYASCLELPPSFSMTLVNLLDPAQTNGEPTYQLLNSLAIFRRKLNKTQADYAREYAKTMDIRREIAHLEKEHTRNQEKLNKKNERNRELLEQLRKRKMAEEEQEKKIDQLKERKEEAYERCIAFMSASAQHGSSANAF